MDERLERAVAPNLFDVILDPTLAFTLVLANLMSPRLWELRGRMLHAAEPTAPQIQNLLDHHFEHLSPARVAELNGVFDLDVLDMLYGKDAIERVRTSIVATLDWRVSRGTSNQQDLALDLIGQRKFPAYTYGTIDEAWAHRRLLQQRKHKPFGLTCCLDEAAIFTALFLILGERSVGDIALLGSPTHYTVLTWHGDEKWWFYSKHELFSAPAWAQFTAAGYGDNRQMAFDDRLPDFDRIMTMSGSYLLTTGECSMPERYRAAIIERIDAFFGFRPAQLAAALQRPQQPVAGLDVAQLVDSAASAPDANAARATIRNAALRAGNLAALRALYTYRTLDVPDPSCYLQSARHSCQIENFLPQAQTIDDAMRAVNAISGTESIFEDPNRIAMPEETARYATGTVRDKALLLHVLLERILGVEGSPGAGLETLFSDTDSFVRSTQFCISVSRMAYVPQIEGNIRYRIAAGPHAAYAAPAMDPHARPDPGSQEPPHLGGLSAMPICGAHFLV